MRVGYQSLQILALLAMCSTPLLAGVTEDSAQFDGPRVFAKFNGRVAVSALSTSYANPFDLPGTEICDDGIDNNENGSADYGHGQENNKIDPDCLINLPTQDILLRMPFAAVQTVNGAAAAFHTGTDRNLDGVSELLLDSSGEGGLKHSYLRSGGDNSYDRIRVRALILPGAATDAGGPIAIRIQEDTGESYYVRTTPDADVAIMKDNGDGTSTELASAGSWASGAAVNIPEADGNTFTCYQVTFEADGNALSAVIDEIGNCGTQLFESVANRLIPRNTVTLNATDDSLSEGFFGLRSFHDNTVPGGPDTKGAELTDCSVVDLHIEDPREQRDFDAPKIFMFTGSFGHDFRDFFDYSVDPSPSRKSRLWNRANGPVSEQFMSNYFRSMGFVVDEVPFSGMSSGLVTPEEVNAEYRLWYFSGAGGSSSTRGFMRDITIPIIFGEHVAGENSWGGAYSTPARKNNGNEQAIDCRLQEPPDRGPCSGDWTIDTAEDKKNCQGLSHLRVFPAELFGAPEHPIIRGLADENGNIPVMDARRMNANLGYKQPPDGFKTISGTDMMSVAQNLEAREWGYGIPETQMAGWPPAGAEDGTGWALAGFANPCDPNGPSLLESNIQFTADKEGTPAKGHTSVMAVEAGTPRVIRSDLTEDCIAPCEWNSRVAFLWPSDRNYHYATPEALVIYRRTLLWVLGLLNSPNRSSTLFRRGDSDASGDVDLTDAVYSLNALFQGGPEPSCRDAADANDDEQLDLTDAVYTLNRLFQGGPAIPAPVNIGFQGCGLDFTPSERAGEVGNPDLILSCVAYDACGAN